MCEGKASSRAATLGCSTPERYRGALAPQAASTPRLSPIHRTALQGASARRRGQAPAKNDAIPHLIASWPAKTLVQIPLHKPRHLPPRYPCRVAHPCLLLRAPKFLTYETLTVIVRGTVQTLVDVFSFPPRGPCLLPRGYVIPRAPKFLTCETLTVIVRGNVISYRPTLAFFTPTHPPA